MSENPNPDLAKYGYFDHEDKCFVLKNEPPHKWVNLHYNKIGEYEVYAETSNIGDGTVSVRDNDGAKCMLVGYDAKYLYARDDETNKTFCPWGAPAPTDVEDKSCRFYAAKTVTQSTCDDLRVTQRNFVPREGMLGEIWTCTVENLSNRPRKVSVFAYAMFQLNGNDAKGSGFGKVNVADVMADINGVFLQNLDKNVPTDRFKGYLVCTNDYAGGTGYRDNFLRSEFAVGTPKIMWGWNCDNKPGYGPDCAGAVQASVEIAPGETKRVDFLLGQAANVEEVKTVLKTASPEWIDKACAEQEAFEDENAEKFLVRTGNGDYDALMNFFVKKQMYSYFINKSGFRDNLQNGNAFDLVDPEVSKQNLIRALGSQYENGCVPHGFRPLNPLQYSDKPAWIMLAVPGLIKETGDLSFLDIEVPYFENKDKGTVLDHCLRSMRFLANDTGKNGLCDQHHADWNDGLEATPESGERESVMVTQQLCYGLLEMIEIAKRIGRTDIEEEAQGYYDTFKQRLNEVAWDGEWYVRTICGDGYRIGSKENKEGKIFLNPQSWAILSKTAPEDRAKTAFAAVDKFIKEDVGYRICNPGFSERDPRVGRMSEGIPDHIENGGCYNHAAGFKGVADCMMGRAEEAWQTFVKVIPGNPENPISRSQVEPFSFTNSYSKFERIYGVGGYPWRTGTAAWFTVLLVEWILGARRHYDGLLIDPCLSKELKNVGVVRSFRGTRYEIEIDNSAGRCTGAQEITVDGEKLDGNIIKPSDKKVCKVQVVV